MAYMLVPVLDVVTWYSVQDAYWGEGASDFYDLIDSSAWPNAYYSITAKAGWQVLSLVGVMVAMDAFGMVYYYGAALGAVWELVNIYFVNAGLGDFEDPDSSAGTVAYALCATSAVLSVGAFMGMSGMDKDDEEEYYYYEDYSYDDYYEDDYYGGYYGYYY